MAADHPLAPNRNRPRGCGAAAINPPSRVILTQSTGIARCAGTGRHSVDQSGSDSGRCDYLQAPHRGQAAPDIRVLRHRPPTSDTQPAGGRTVSGE